VRVIRPGTAVTVGEDVPAVVLQVAVLAAGHVQYQAAWWDGRVRNVDWFDAALVHAPKGTKRLTLGFTDGT
jgi:hypothetical protein